MLPYFDRVSYSVGPLTFHVWGLFIALGIAAFLVVLRREVRVRGLNYERFLDMTLWVAIAAFIGSRLSHVFFYEPHYYLAHPLDIVKVWEGGMSSLGGIVVGTLTALWFVRKHHMDVWNDGDAICRSLPAAWIIGRFGCYLTHMHPGAHTTLPFAVAYPDGPRHDLGLYESVAWLVIGLVFWLFPRARRSGTYVALLPLMYAPVRFALDFLRARDVMMPDMRYAGLTPAQYGMILLFIGGVFLFRHVVLHRNLTQQTSSQH